MNKKDLSERDICSKFVGPAVKRAGWDGMMQIREGVAFTKGRIIVRGKLVSRGNAKRADYILCYKPNTPIAIIEAKDNNHSVGDGMQQALDYAATLNIPFVFSSNGDGFVFNDRTGISSQKEASLTPDEFPSAGELWAKYRQWKILTPDEEGIVLQDYYDEAGGAALLPMQCRERRCRSDRQGPESRASRHGHSRLSDHLAPVEGRPQETHPLSRRPSWSNRDSRMLRSGSARRR
jgi:type I restriction enzyme R subunit